MTYVEYCRMKCFSKINNSDEDKPTKSDLEHQKRMSLLSKKKRSDQECKQPYYDDSVAMEEASKEYEASRKSCLKNEGKDCKGDAAVNAEDALFVSRKTCKSSK